MSLNGARHDLELRADVVRDRLLDTIGAIDRRRHDVIDWKRQLFQHARQVALVSAALLGGIALAAGAGVYRAKRRAADRRGERLRALGRVWDHPERLAVRRRRPLQRVMLSAFAAVVALAVARIAGTRR